jgi:acyl carrier protein
MAKAKEEVLADVNRIFCEVLNNPSLQLKYETTANEVKNWDSIAEIELVVAIEQHFKMRFNFAELQKFQKVGDWCDSIAEKLAACS